MKLIFFISIFNSIFIIASSQNVGIGTSNPTQKLDVVGNLRVSGAIMPGGTAGTTGQALVSNGAGQAPSWENIAYSGGGRFWATISNSIRAGTQTPTGRGVNWILNDNDAITQADTFDFASVFVKGTDISVSNEGFLNNYITINKAGLYHFEGVLRLFVTGDVDGPVMTPRAFLQLELFKAGFVNSTIYMEEVLMQLTSQPSTGFGNKGYNYSIKFDVDINLEAGTTVAFIGGFNQLRMNGTFPLIAMGFTSGGYISGHFISE
jgi:hypothetical protein